jgi:hypothetical protein
MGERTSTDERTEEHLEMIIDCEQRESRLTEWEVGFIDSVRNHIERGQSLSIKQETKLIGIWNNATDMG